MAPSSWQIVRDVFTARSGPRWLAPLSLLLVTGSLLALSTTLAKVAASVGLAALPFLMWSVLGAAVLLFLLAAHRNGLPSLTPRSLEYFLLSALISVAVPNLLFFSAIPHVGVGFVALSIALPPLLTYAGALLLRMERFDVLRACGVGCALLGVAAIAVPKLSAQNAATSWIVATLAGPVFLAAGNLYRTLRWPPGERPEALAPGMLAASGMLLAAFSLLPGQAAGLPLDRWEPSLLILAQIATFTLQYRLFFALQKRGGPVYLSLLGSVSAVLAVPIAIFLLGELPPEGLVPGAGAIALGILLVTVRRPAG